MWLLAEAEFRRRMQVAMRCFEKPTVFTPPQIPRELPRFTCRIQDPRGKKLRENQPLLLSDDGGEITSYIPPGEKMWTHRGIWRNYQPTFYRHWRDKPYTFAYICKAPPADSATGISVPSLAGEVDWVYVNICRPPTFDGELLLAVDLVLDVLIWPDGGYFVDDEDELAEMLECGDVTETDAAFARRAAAEIVSLPAPFLNCPEFPQR